jgi:hypothetical protein
MAEEPNRDLFPLCLRIPGDGKARTFENEGGLKRFADGERDWFDLLQKLPTVGDLTASVTTRYKEAIGKLSQVAYSLDTTAAGLAKLHDALLPYNKGTVLPIDSQVGQFLVQEIDNDPYGVLGIMAEQSGDSQESGVRNAISAGRNSDLPLTVFAGQRLRERYSEDRRTEAAAARLSDMERGAEELKKQMEELANVLKVRVTEDTMATPASFWKTKTAGHGDRMNAYAVLFLALGGLFVATDLYYGVPFLEAKLKVQSLELWPLAIGALIVGLQIWALRILVRLFYAEQHLREDARERSVMVRTLLTLAKQPLLREQLNAEVLPTAFEILFRPAAKGVIQDEGAPTDLVKVAEAFGGAVGKAKS